MKHSKGTWTDKLSDFQVIPGACVNVSVVDENEIVKECIYHAGYSEETRANAKLIAASPNMLQTLIMLKNGLNYMQQTKKGEHILNDEYVQLILETIDKATK